MENKTPISYSERKNLHIERLELIQEEIKIFMNIDSKVVENHLEVSTVAGTFKYNSSEKTMMGDVYRLISHYGGKLQSWGLSQKLKESKNT